MLALLLGAITSSQTLFSRLDPTSVPEQLAYYTLYPETPEGKKARERLSQLLGTNEIPSSSLEFQAILDFFANNRISTSLPPLANLGHHLKNRQLKGYGAASVEEILALPAQEVDLARALLLTSAPEQTDSYEAMIDLMALQILARTSFGASDDEKIDAINDFLFREMHMRFPPHSLWAKDVDVYTFLPDILDSRRGVCLGVSALYLCIAQRLGLELTIITPPGHIYLACGERNIETTARGIHMPDETYLGVQSKCLQKRTIKEVVGMTFVNAASTLWQAGRMKEAIATYEKARPFIPDDPLCQELLGYCYLLTGEKKKAIKLLEPLRNYCPAYSDVPNTLIADVLDKKAPPEGITAIFSHVDETRESILTKQQELASLLKKYPKFRAGHFAHAITYLQLGRQREAIEILRRCPEDDPTVNYYLAALSAERFDYPSAWSYLELAETLTASYNPRALRELRRALTLTSPQ